MMVGKEDKEVIHILKDLNKLTSSQVFEAQESCKDNPLNLEDELIRRAWVTIDDIHHARALQFNMEVYEDLSTLYIPEDIAKKVPYTFAKNHVILPIKLENEQVLVAVSDPLNLNALEEIRYQLGLDVHAVYSPSQTIMEAINRRYDLEEGIASGLLANMDPSVGKNSHEDKSDSYDLLEEGDNAPVIKLLNAIISEAIQQGASDIHFEPFEKDLRVRYRIDGALHNRHSPPKEYQAQLITRIKVMAKLDIAERRLPQDGRIKLNMGGREIDFRVSTAPVINGERIVLRILDKGNISLGLEHLGMDENTLRKFRDLIKLPEGIVLVTGPTGSGKTTTLYSAIQEISTDEINIMTIEDPVEYKLPNIAQIGIHPKIDLDFAKGLRHILRQDPDVIMVGEIRDGETAEVATQASLTGHLVLSTLHTNDAPSAITRLVDMGIEPYLLTSSLIGVLAQRLLRKICPHCRESYKPSNEELQKLGLQRKDLDNEVLYKGKGCNQCFNSGYKGRHGIYELMIMSNKMKRQVTKDSDATNLREIAIQEGMISLRFQGALLVQEGITTVGEVLRVTRNTEIEG
ncbi:MAG: general secretion pathway protein E [Chlamydiales bacterium]|jgi:general secretion pathway protein E